MNTEKQIAISDLKAKFTKDFDTFGKMDPFIQFTVGKCLARTETANSMGKEPVWKNTVTLTYFDQSVISLKAYDEDGTQNQYIGSAKIEIKTLRTPGGAIEVSILTDDGQNVGTLTGKYTIKNLNPVPLLLVKNIRCNFVKQLDIVVKSKPFFQISTDETNASTEVKEGELSLNISWNEQLRLRIKESSKVWVSLIDKNQADSYIFKYESNAKEFRLQGGTKKFNVFDKNYFYLGTAQFDYETLNLVSKEESVKNTQRDKKLQGELTSINIQKVKTEFKKGNVDIYYHFIVGTNKIETEVMKSVPSTSNFDLKKIVYADSKENKLTVLIWQSNMLKDKVIGWAAIPLQGLAGGDKKVALMNAQNKQEVGSISLTLAVKQIPAKVITLDNISVQFVEGGDLIGESQPYIVARIGGASNRTETGDKNKWLYKRGIQLKFFQEDLIEIQVYDQDITNDEILYTQQIKLSDLKVPKGEYSSKLIKKGETSLADRTKLSFKYQIKNNKPEVKPQVKPEVKPQVKPEVKPQVKPQVKPEVKPQVKPQVKQAEVKPQVKEVKEVKHEIKPQVKQQEKPKVEQPKKQLPKQEVQISNSSKTISANNSKRKTQQSRKNQHIVLPAIINHLNYGDKIYDKQSSSTLQKSIVAFSVPKANRFLNEPKYSGQPSYCLDSCFKSNPSKGAGIGFGRKRQFPDWMQKNMKENPAPGAYIEVSSDSRPKGPTFGISHKYYQKVLIAKQKPTQTLTNRSTFFFKSELSPIKDRIRK